MSHVMTRVIDSLGSLKYESMVYSFKDFKREFSLCSFVLTLAHSLRFLFLPIAIIYSGSSK